MKPLLTALLLGLSLSATAADLKPMDAAAAEALLGPQVKQQLQAPALKGQFKQSKTLRELPMPLLSSGEFLLARGLGVDWQLRQPVALDYVLTPTALIERSNGRSRRTSAAEQPSLAAASRLMLALFGLDLRALETEFRIAGGRDGKRWQLQLTPRNAALAGAFGEALIEGETLPLKVRLRDGQGDVTELEFSALQSQPQLSAADRARFE